MSQGKGVGFFTNVDAFRKKGCLQAAASSLASEAEAAAVSAIKSCAASCVAQIPIPDLGPIGEIAQIPNLEQLAQDAVDAVIDPVVATVQKVNKCSGGKCGNITSMPVAEVERLKKDLTQNKKIRQLIAKLCPNFDASEGIGGSGEYDSRILKALELKDVIADALGNADNLDANMLNELVTALELCLQRSKDLGIDFKLENINFDAIACVASKRGDVSSTMALVTLAKQNGGEVNDELILKNLTKALSVAEAAYKEISISDLLDTGKAYAVGLATDVIKSIAPEYAGLIPSSAKSTLINSAVGLVTDPIKSTTAFAGKWVEDKIKAGSSLAEGWANDISPFLNVSLTDSLTVKVAGYPVAAVDIGAVGSVVHKGSDFIDKSINNVDETAVKIAKAAFTLW